MQICDVVELTFYANGIISGDTPFRPYSYSSVQAYIRDMQDGFYPSELQENNPEGVIFKVSTIICVCEVSQSVPLACKKLWIHYLNGLMVINHQLSVRCNLIVTGMEL